MPDRDRIIELSVRIHETRKLLKVWEGELDALVAENAPPKKPLSVAVVDLFGTPHRAIVVNTDEPKFRGVAGQVLSFMIGQPDHVFTAEEIAQHFTMPNANTARATLSRLVKARRVTRLERGKYTVKKELEEPDVEF